eukprot:TRINITY_DN9652_c0_g1_i1.p1 TRINITY_DN9652_c0_g1~~TRINITY_DN9652_c0_g1_i1.p1  ORF type:complete len:194 (+),score=16.65 TRINITY_DN9652_c0_g1_i1:122-703(+)
MSTLQKFINAQAHAIHDVDPGALVTVGAWSFLSMGYGGGSNVAHYYSDSALVNSASGAYPKGKLDYYQVHWYNFQGSDKPNPFSLTPADFPLLNDKPILIGEFSSSAGNGQTTGAMINTAKTKGYAGAWVWQWSGGPDSDSQSQIMEGLSQVAYGDPNAVTFAFSLKGDNGAMSTAPSLLLIISLLFSLRQFL